MNPWLVLTIVLFSMLAGAFVVAVLIFFYVLLENVKKMTRTIEGITASIDQKSIVRVMNSMVAIAVQGEKILQAMDSLTRAATIINKSFFRSATESAPESRVRPNTVRPGVDHDTEGEMADEEDSGFSAVGEEDAARNENLHALEKMGLPSDDRKAPQPTEDMVVRVEA